MNLDELQSIRDRERQSDSLQQLRESFYQDVGEFVQGLREERDAVAARADDPFDAPEVNRLTDDIKTAEQTVEAIYERRVGKLVKMASFAAADMPTEDEGLTAEERDLFEQLVAAIEGNREHVFALVDGEDAPAPTDIVGDESPTDAVQETAQSGTDSPTGATDVSAPTPSGEPDSTSGGDVGAADLMGGEGPSTDEADTADPADEIPESESDSPDRSAGAEARAIADDVPAPASGEPTSDAPPANTDSIGADEPSASGPNPTGREGLDDESAHVGSEDGASATDRAEPADATDAGRTADESSPRSDGGARGVERTTVRITEDVGEIFGVDEREYDLSQEDVVTLPSANADPLVDSDAAERID